MDDIRQIWDFVLLDLSSGRSIDVGQVVLVLLLVFAGWFGSRLVGYLFARRLASTRLKPDVIYVIKRIVFFALFILVVVTALGLLGIPLTAFAFATGAIAIGVGFGAQNIINNFISGWILMAERPIRIGDFIEIDGTYGSVEQIGNRSTRIRRVDGVHLLVPNSQLLERTVTNWTLIDKQIRTSLRVGVAYGSPVQRVAELILEAVTAQAEVKAEPAVEVIFDDFGDNALIFDAYFWCDVGGQKLLRSVRSEIRFRISALFEEHGIVIAYPQRDVHIDTARPLDVRLLQSDGS